MSWSTFLSDLWKVSSFVYVWRDESRILVYLTSEK